MSIVDILIVLILLLSAVFGFRTGVLRSIASLIGLFAGIAIAGRYYKSLGAALGNYGRDWPLMQVVYFCVIALLVMIVAGLIGLLLKKMIQGIGLGWLDRILGLVFGILRGALLVTLFIVMLAAFFPQTLWLGNSQLARYFLGSVDVTVQMQPGDLRDKIRHGLEVIEKNSQRLLHPK